MIKCNKCKIDREDSFFVCKMNPNKLNKICRICIDEQDSKLQEVKKNNICVRCRQNPAKMNKNHCSDCRKKLSDEQKKRTDLLKINGICQYCNKRPSEKGKYGCEICLEKLKNDSKERIDNLPINKLLFVKMKHKAKIRGIEFTITEDDIIVPEYCPILGYKLERNIGVCQYNSYTLDRINNFLTYIKGNVHVISHRANTLKSSASIDELEKILQYLKGNLLIPNNSNCTCFGMDDEMDIKIKNMIYRSRQRAVQKNLEHSITKLDIFLPEYCPILGIKLQFNKVNSFNSYSIDRIDNTKGYTKENIQIISNLANIIKNNGTIEEFEKVINYMRKLENI